MRATASLVLMTALFLSPLTNSLPLPKTANHQQGSNALEPRRMIPNKTDLLSHIFASLGVEEFNKFNKLHPEEYDDGAPIDDSNAATNTVTSHANEEMPRPSGTVKVEEHVDEDGGETKTTTTTTTYSTVAASAGGADSAATDDMESAAEDPEGFVDTLFEVLRKKLREALNSSDEVAL
ncbi:hypothetical protein BJY00DRAFT_309076 [Aspergillus carlsbadensis]|nr:hypothetical protein BJY00DRAFT_309076 [Aspergillus carlsbadensis]